MRKLKISHTDFELAFELSSYETTAYLDTETGMVIFVQDYVVNQAGLTRWLPGHAGIHLVAGR